MQATHDSHADDPSSSISSLRKNRHEEDVKGAQFVVQSNLKILSKSIAALSKISEDMVIEVNESGLHFKVFHRAKYCVIRFAPEFFNSCDLSMINKKAANICRLSMKSAQRIFKNVASNERNFVECRFQIDPRADKLVVDLEKNSDIHRTISAKLRETSSKLQKPAYDRTKARNVTVLFASCLIPILVQLKNDIEVTMHVDENGLTIRNFHSSDGVSCFNMSDQRDSGKKVKTETTIVADKLSRHNVQIPVEFSFSQKEFMSIVTFAHQLGIEICLYYDLPSKPLVVSVEGLPNFDVELALATMGSDEEVDLDCGVIETMHHPNTTQFSQEIPSSGKSSKINSKETVDITSSESRSKRGPSRKSVQTGEKPQENRPAPSKSPHFASPNASTLPMRENFVRAHETINDEPRENVESHMWNVAENNDFVEEPMDVERMSPERSVQENIVNEFLFPNSALSEKKHGKAPRIAEQFQKSNRRNSDKRNEQFTPPESKRPRVEENRNKKLRSILMGKEPKQDRFTKVFGGLTLVPDTQQ